MTSMSHPDDGPRQGRTTRLILVAHVGPPPSLSTRFAADGASDPGGLRRLAAGGRSLPRFDRVVRSPASAAAETASALKVEAVAEPALRGRESGAWAELDLPAVAAQDPDRLAAWLRDPAAAAPGGESVVALLARLAPWLATQARLGGTVLAIAHPAIIRACLVVAMAVDPAAWFRIDVGHGTRSLLTHAGSVWRVGLVNGPLGPASDPLQAEAS